LVPTQRLVNRRNRGPQLRIARQAGRADDMTATLAPSAKLTSAASSSPALTTVELSIVSEADMAWLLADAADVYLTGYERTMAFVELGSGEHYLAIERILTAAMSSPTTLPVGVFDGLTRWLDGYAGSPEEPQLRTMLAEIRAQQFDLVPLRTQPAQCGDVRRLIEFGVAR
jgi:hypothetical protein